MITIYYLAILWIRAIRIIQFHYPHNYEYLRQNFKSLMMFSIPYHIIHNIHTLCYYFTKIVTLWFSDSKNKVMWPFCFNRWSHTWNNNYMGKYIYLFKSVKYEVLGTPQLLLLYCVCGGVEHSIPMWQHWLSDNLLRHWSDVEVNNAQGGQSFRDLANGIIAEEMYEHWAGLFLLLKTVGLIWHDCQFIKGQKLTILHCKWL